MSFLHRKPIPIPYLHSISASMPYFLACSYKDWSFISVVHV
ncbi:hypothetical protein ACU8KH_00434 [Lachancea thermotolerans]